MQRQSYCEGGWSESGHGWRKKVVKNEVSQPCLTLCEPVDCSPPGVSIHGVLQARILEWVAISFSRGSSQTRNRTHISLIAGRFFTSWATREAQEDWSGWPIPSPADLPDPGIEPGSPELPKWDKLYGEKFGNFLSKIHTLFYPQIAL